MTIRKIYVFILLLGFTFGCTPTKDTQILSSHTGNEKAIKQNVLFIAIDDLKPLLNVYGYEHIKTPNIDRLAKQGTVFLNNHCQQAVCAPSRASLMTGMYPDHTKVWDLKTLIRDRNPDVITIPQHFKNNGYQTAAMGKIYDLRSVDKKHDALSWSIPYQNIDPSEYESVASLDAKKSKNKPYAGHYRNPITVAKGKALEQEARDKGKKPRKYALKKLKPITERIDIEDEGYMDGVLGKMGVEQLQAFSKSDKPFFLSVGFKKPHLPFVAPKKYWEMYDATDIKLAEYQEKSKNGIKRAYHNSGELGSYSDSEGNFIYKGLDNRKLSEAEQRHLIHGYYACVSFVDAQVGKLLDELDKLNLTKNTTIVLWGDHGWHLGDHGLWCKHSNFEQATRSPLIIATPNGKGNTTTTPTGFVDLFPTLCELNGLETPKQAEGESLIPIIKNPKTKRAYTISQFHRGKKIMGYAVRTENYRYVQWMKMEYQNGVNYQAKIAGKELYDYQKDPNETVNYADDAAYAAIVKEHQTMLKAFFEKM